MKKSYTFVQSALRRKSYLLAALALLASAVAPILSGSQASAASFTNRSLSLSNNTTTSSLATTDYSFSITVPTGASTSLGSVEVDFCTTALWGTCATPSGMVVSGATMGTTSPASGGTISSSQTGTPNSGLVSSGTAPQVRFKWGSVQTLTLPQTVTFIISTIQNPTSAGSFYARVGFFSDTAYTTLTDKGVVAQAVNSLQNVSFKVAETLAFCVGGMQNATVAYGSFSSTNISADCAQGTTPAISLGTAPDTTTTCVSPVSVRSATCDDAASVATQKYGFAMLRTNASNGSVIGYRPNNNGSTYTQGVPQVASASCTFVSVTRTDNCINAVNEDQGGTGDIGKVAPWITGSGTNEEFGMVVPAVSSTGKATSVLTNNPGAVSAINRYIGSGNLSGGTACTTGGAAGQDCWNWHRTGTATIASASGPVDNEALQIFFASKASTTTPTGSFSVDVDYYAVPTY